MNDKNCILLDCRAKLDFSKAFVPGSYHVDLASNFALFVGKIITPDNTFLLICDPGKE